MAVCPFKVGDLVLRTGESNWSGIERGGIYEVVSITAFVPGSSSGIGPHWTICLKGFKDMRYASYKFELTKREKTTSGFGSFVQRIES